MSAAIERGAFRAPLFTWGVAAAAALALLAPDLAELSRSGLGAGEPWRLWTGHLAHHGLYHFAVDAGTWLFLGLLYERRVGTARWAAVSGLSALAISAAFLLFEPGLESYRGLSGVDCAAFAAALVAEARDGRRRSALLGILFAAKLVWEQASGGFLFPSLDLGPMGVPVLSAHLAGAVAGLLVALVRPGRAPAAGDRAARGGCARRASAGGA